MPTHKKHSSENIAKQLKIGNEILEKQNRLSRRFLFGLFFGIGTAIGATAVGGIAIYFISKMLEAAGLPDIPLKM